MSDGTGSVLEYHSPRVVPSAHRKVAFWLLVLAGGVGYYALLMAVGMVSMVFDGAHAEYGRGPVSRMGETVSDRLLDLLRLPAFPAPGDAGAVSIILRLLVNPLVWGSAFAALVRCVVWVRRARGWRTE
jgi:hypothetical protein